MLPNILNIKYQGSLCCRCILTLVSNICEAAMISLFRAPTQQIVVLNKLPAFWVSLQHDWQMDYGVFNSPVLACTQTLIYTRGAQNYDFAAVLQTDLTKSLVPSVAQANIKGVGLVLH